MKPPKFLICTNQLVKPERIFILHTQKPRFWGEIKIFQNSSDYQAWHNELLSENSQIFGAETTLKDKIIAFYVIDFFDMPEPYDLPQPGKVITGGLMSRTGDWIHAYFRETLKDS